MKVLFLNLKWKGSKTMIQYEVALEQLEIFVLILMRIASFIYVAPFFNTANVPRRTKIGLAFL